MIGQISQMDLWSQVEENFQTIFVPSEKRSNLNIIVFKYKTFLS